MMDIHIIGISHNTAPLPFREKVFVDTAVLPRALKEALTELNLEELVLLSTCNRTELYCYGVTNPEPLVRWLACFHKVKYAALMERTYRQSGQEAIRHLMRVAAGLDSLILGEPQIFGQLKSAYALALEEKTIGVHLKRLFRAVFGVAKEVRTKTGIGERPVSIAYAACLVAKQIFSDLPKARTLLIGAGDVIELVARHLFDRRVGSFVVVNRTYERACQLAERYGGKAACMADLNEQLIVADIVIVSTASQHALLKKSLLKPIMKKRNHRPLLLLDLAVPRDVEARVGELANVYLYSIDDLQRVVDDNLKTRETHAKEAEHLITKGAKRFMRSISSLDAVTLLKDYRTHTEKMRDQVLEKGLRQLESGNQPEQVLRVLAYQLTNKIMHNPSIQLKKASIEGRQELFASARKLFGLDD